MQLDTSKPYLYAIYHLKTHSKDALKAVFIEMAKQCKKFDQSKALLVSETKEKVSQADIFNAVVEVAPLFLDIKMSYCDLYPNQDDVTEFGVLVAQNRGINVNFFTQLEAAEKWILED